MTESYARQTLRTNDNNNPNCNPRQDRNTERDTFSKIAYGLEGAERFKVL